MTKPEHTPGPWEIVYGNKTEDSGFTIMSQNGGGLIAICWPPPRLPHTPLDKDLQAMVLANAQLIAAAPDLLKACKAAADLLERAPEIPNYKWWHRAVISHCLTVIAQAEGNPTL